MLPMSLVNEEQVLLNNSSLYQIITRNLMQTIGKDATIARVIDTFEGGYVNNPHDAGGATNMGITLNTYRSVNPLATSDDIKNLNKQVAIDIYTKLYWNQFHIDKMPVDIQDVVFDTFVQHNPITAGKIVQKALNSLDEDISVDGVLGENSFTAMNNVNAKELRAAILVERKRFYENQAASHPSQEQFLDGWLRRLKELT